MLKGTCHDRLVLHSRVSDHKDVRMLLHTSKGSHPCGTRELRVITFTGKTDVPIRAVWVNATSLIEYFTEWPA